ncbi:MAG: hypothetical protein IKT97_01970 [Spirochaetia bacterium]|nr:hypothetical protein [Spirochaetia bacterium]
MRVSFHTAEEYLSYRYTIPPKPALLPLPDEPFVSLWKEMAGKDVLHFLSSTFALPTEQFPFKKPEALKIHLAPTAGGQIPVISTGCHDDLCSMEALVNGHSDIEELPLTVNALTIEARAAGLLHHRVILLGNAPYSNVPASALDLDEDDWLNRSAALRRAHECAHYETLRLFGGMKNHALDEIAADSMGQLAAFGNFSAQRQRLFFGLEGGGKTCTGRLTFYCRKVIPWERTEVYQAVDRALDIIEAKVAAMCKEKATHYKILTTILNRSIIEL